MKLSKTSFLFLLSLFLSIPGYANQANITGVEVTENSGSFRFDVTLRHDDAGWDHYADGWEVLSPTGDVLGKRVLAHPHVSEQPFTRSLSGVKIPQELGTVSIRAHDSVHGYNKKVFEVRLPGR
jgi:hypothetical protein